MNFRNLMICGIENDSESNILYYYCRDLDSPYLTEFTIKQMGKKYPSDFFVDVLQSNGHLAYTKGKEYKYDWNYINQFLPLVFTAVCEADCLTKDGKIKSEINSHDLIVIPNLEVREMAKIRKAILLLNDGIGS